ncbi:hypothetical protein E2C01_017699 [Portunus trituberculatus]|uniref:Uncharacterized protein n=1 Tax=Portunus trituberculatus TaxID=210409 RepID=A0A5B7DSN6_PORTR|nr:hypothetical protein [Portunus trituberculatus]
MSAEDDGVVIGTVLHSSDKSKVTLVVLNAADMTELARASFTTASQRQGGVSDVKRRQEGVTVLARNTGGRSDACVTPGHHYSITRQPSGFSLAKVISFNRPRISLSCSVSSLTSITVCPIPQVICSTWAPSSVFTSFGCVLDFTFSPRPWNIWILLTLGIGD